MSAILIVYALSILDDHGRFILMLLTACSAEAALAEETSVGVTYFITEVASMHGLRSAGIAALLLRVRLSFLCDYPPYGSHDPTIAVCIV